MQKVDKPKKPLLVYYLIAIVAIILVNQVLFPAMVKQEVKEVVRIRYLLPVLMEKLTKQR